MNWTRIRGRGHLLLGSGGLAAVLVFGGAASAGGFLWLGSEYAGEGSIYRYNISAGMIDLAVPVSAPDHWNNIATDGRFIYGGHPTSNRLAVIDIDTGALLQDLVYSEPLSGHKEDGAYNSCTGHLWRVTYSGPLHETTNGGDVLNSYVIDTGLVGLAWVENVLYSTNWDNGDFGRVQFDGDVASFVHIPWLSGADPPGSSSAALAYDSEDDVFYAIANDHELYCLTLTKDGVGANFVVDLTTVGYPAGALADGMGWYSGSRCVEDIANLDGVVDVDDLLLLLGSWGPCPQPCPPNCLADIVPSGEVDVNDLLALLAVWGPCDSGG